MAGDVSVVGAVQLTGPRASPHVTVRCGFGKSHQLAFHVRDTPMSWFRLRSSGGVLAKTSSYVLNCVQGKRYPENYHLALVVPSVSPGIERLKFSLDSHRGLGVLSSEESLSRTLFQKPPRGASVQTQISQIRVGRSR